MKTSQSADSLNVQPQTSPTEQEIRLETWSSPGFRQFLSSPPNFRAPGQYLTPFLLLLAVYCGWILSLPLFPTQDDAMHLYYVNVLHHLLSGHSVFSDFYAVRHPIPPYTVQYLVLLALTTLLEQAVAEKCMVCLIVASTAFGFRYLAIGIGPTGRLLSLWVFPVALSWPLFMGFHNFCLAVSLALWSLGLWIRAAKTPRKLPRVAFLLSVTVVLLTHPVPLLFLLGAVGADVAARVLSARFAGGYSWRMSVLRQRLNLAWAGSAYLSLTYITLFLNKSVPKEPQVPGERMAELSSLLHMQHVSFASGGLWTKFHRAGLCFILILAVVLAYRTCKKGWFTRRLTTASALLLCTVTLFLALPFIPSRMNGLDYFADRLPIFLWLFALAAASAATATPSLQRVSSVLAIGFALFTIAMTDRLIRPVAREINSISNSKVQRRDAAHPRIGLIFDAPVKIQHAELSFNPFFRWSGVRYVEQTGGLLLDDPWAGAPNILPVNRVSNRTAAFSQHDFQYPDYIYKQLLDSPEKRDAVLSKIDFVLFVGRPAPDVVEPLLAIDSPRHWICDQSSWYFVCNVTPGNPGAPHLSLRPLATGSDERNKVFYRRDSYPRAQNNVSQVGLFTYTRQN